jgi:hypothetical protein
MKRKRTGHEVRSRPTPEEFIRAWQTSRTLREACTKLRMRRAVAKVRAYRYRQRGVPLKVHDLDPVVECYPDWEELSKFAASLVAPGEAANDLPADGAEAGSAPAPA